MNITVPSRLAEPDGSALTSTARPATHVAAQASLNRATEKPGPEGLALAQHLQRALQNTQAHEPVPLNVQAKLSPLLGRSVEQIQIIRDAHAAEATAAATADALAVGNAVLIAPGQDLASPQGLGLLAHEMTHVLRDRDPTFVPAVARSHPFVPASVALTGEEALAEHVERNVRQVTRHNEEPAQESLSWNGLPAPWEPMPYWDTPLAERPGQPGHTDDAGPAALRQVNALPSMPPPTGAGSGGQMVRAASSNRSAGPSAPSSSSSSGSGQDNQREVAHDRRKPQKPIDLDFLAQQVYGHLRKRLSLELRRDR